MDFIDALLNPDRDEFPNRTIVVNAANLLQIGEFQLLQLAFAHWHGRDMRPDEASAIFDSFMVRSEVPGWALMYARNIDQLEQDGQLNGNQPEFHRYDAEFRPAGKPDARTGFLTAVVFLVGTLGGAFAFAGQLAECTDQFPPCLSSGELSGSRAQ
ncbi:MAG: hypothetical protein HOF11_21140 [Rhodospirillaceae bacterium]|jgi:hypothetical protein|nr:hypothetical protein [Rhodospirillaceae bacterium]